uniref:Queuosine 5'-phosphate N-glycosylase/hydrolase n=1 Tax=Angiostrongylus cantonensis TaxID=6313 RepID=A0A0K0DEJ8_ANGCA
MNGALSPFESGRFIVEHAKHVRINDEAVQKVAGMILDSMRNGSIVDSEFAAQALHPKQKGKSAVDWVFFVDTINFSFWPDEGSKYDVTYNGVRYTGYFAVCAAVNKVLESGLDITSAEWMANAQEEAVDNIFKSDGGKFDSSFCNCVVAANGSAVKLLEIIVENFESFRDFAIFCGQKVSFLKRAQILVADVYGALKDSNPECTFSDIGCLTMFADYRVPQALAFLGVLEYSKELMGMLTHGRHLPSGSPEEVELRGASIWACELQATEGDAVLPVHAMDVDIFAWTYRRKHAAEIERKTGRMFRMFKKFDDKEDITGAIQLKSSVQGNFKLIKCKDHVELVADHNGVVQFFKTRNTEWVPTLRLLHKYPFILPHQQASVDKGAIKFVLNGSSVMCPGLTSPGAKMTAGILPDAIVAIMAEGKQHALAIGQMKMSSEDIQSVNKDVGIENVHFLTDGLWRLTEKSLN